MKMHAWMSALFFVNMPMCLVLKTLRPTSRFEKPCSSKCWSCIAQYQCLLWSTPLQISGSMVQRCCVEDVYGTTISDHRVTSNDQVILSGSLPLNLWLGTNLCLSLSLSPAPPISAIFRNDDESMSVPWLAIESCCHLCTFACPSALVPYSEEI